jgi:L-iditol 2-dehydrogenase
MSATMTAAMYYGPGDVRVEEVPRPAPPEDGILVRVEGATTCGTDVKTFVRGYWNTTPPSPFGHEFAGTVVAVGARANAARRLPALAEGMRVAVANSAPCHGCFWCRRGDFSLCTGITYLFGAFAEYVAVPGPIVRDNVYELPATVAAFDACLTEPLACALHGVQECGLRLGDTIAINGAGPIGLMFVRLAKLEGARVISCDRVAGRLEAARGLGADEVVDVSQVDDQVAAVRELTDGRGPDVAVEAVGLPDVWQQTVAMVRRGGTAVLFGGTRQGATLELDAHQLHYDALTVKGVYHHTPDYIERALGLIVRGEVSAAQFVTRRMPLDRIVEALELHRDQKVIKVGLDPDGAGT